MAVAKNITDKVRLYERSELQSKPYPLRILSDRGIEFCGKPDTHEYELFLVINNIVYSKAKVKNPQSNGICELFQKTVLYEFYRIAFRKKIYLALDELQHDLSDWIGYYNDQGPHKANDVKAKH